MSSRRRRQAGPISAAGIIAFYEEYEGRIKLSPFSIIAIALAFTAIVVGAHIILP